MSITLIKAYPGTATLRNDRESVFWTMLTPFHNILKDDADHSPGDSKVSVTRLEAWCHMCLSSDVEASKDEMI